MPHCVLVQAMGARNEMGANVFRFLRTQRDLLRMFTPVMGSPSDSVRQ